MESNTMDACEFARYHYTTLFDDYEYEVEKNHGCSMGQSAVDLSSPVSPVILRVYCHTGTCHLDYAIHERRNSFWDVNDMFDLVSRRVRVPDIATPVTTVEKAGFIVQNIHALHEALSDENIKESVKQVGEHEKRW